MPAPGRISLMAAGELRDAIAAYQRGDTAAFACAIASIDPESWAAIERRLGTLGGALADMARKES